MRSLVLAFDLADAPCSECWKHLEQLDSPLGGPAGECSYCHNPVGVVSLDLQEDVHKGVDLVGGFHEFEEELDVPESIALLRFSKTHFPTVDSVRARVLKSGSALSKLTRVDGLRIDDRPDHFSLSLHKTSQYSSRRVRVAQFEPGLFALAKCSAGSDALLTIRSLGKDYGPHLAKSLSS